MTASAAAALCVYLLRSEKKAVRTYVGYSPDPRRRLRQHNGELAGGDAPCVGRPWQLVLFVGGFTSKHSALAFESAWQRPDVSRHIRRLWAAEGQGRCSGRMHVRVRLHALRLLLENGVWADEPLAVCVACAVPWSCVRSSGDWAREMKRLRAMVPVSCDEPPQQSVIVLE